MPQSTLETLNLAVDALLELSSIRTQVDILSHALKMDAIAFSVGFVYTT